MGKRTWLWATAVWAAGCGPPAFAPVLEDPSLLAGMKAGLACSAHFVAGRELASILADELRGIPPGADALPDPVIDAAARSVSVRFADELPPRVAFYRDGFGCTTLPPGAVPEDAAPVPSLPRPSGDPRDIPWPDGDRLPEAPPSVELETVVAAAFDGETYGSGTRTIGIAIVHRGQLVAERYAEGFGPHVQLRSWSVAKTLTGALVGIAVGAGKLRVEDPAPIPEWQAPGDPRAAIRLEDLLHMSSGLQSEGAGSYPVYYGGADSIQAITSVPLETEPGTRWHYANRDTLLLVRALRQAIGDDAEYLSLPRRLFDRIGMRDTVAEVDWHGNFVLSSQVFTTARDLARFGLFYLQDGTWNGERILPEGWLEYSRRPAPGRATGIAALLRYRLAGLLGYGAQLWLLGGLPFVPDDAYGAQGSRGQSVAILPSRELVVVRTALDAEPGDALWRQDRFIADVVDAL